MTVGYESESPWSNPLCVASVDTSQIVDNQISIECTVVMRGRYVMFIRNPGGLEIYTATLCEVVVMGRRIISTYQ